MAAPQDDGEVFDVVYVIGTYPSLTTTFIDREIATLHRRGVRVRVVAMRRPTGTLSEDQRPLAGLVDYLLPVSWWFVLAAHLRVLTTRPARYARLLVELLSADHADWRARLWTFFHIAEGVCVAHLVHRRTATRRLHAHFLDRAAMVALVASRLLDVPYSVTGHASDIFVDPVLLPDKLRAAESVTTCTEYNARHLSALLPHSQRGKVRCVHHGIDAELFRPDPVRRREEPPVILAVAQLKERKGLVHLVEACRLLRDRGHRFRCEIVGDGPLRGSLDACIEQWGLGDVVTMRGALPADRVRDCYRTAAVFALPCVLGEDGDRDGIPNVILEAMAMAVPVVSTHHSGIPEAVRDGETGLLVPRGDSEALAEAIGRILDDPSLAQRLGDRGRRIVLEKFDVEANARRFLEGLGV